MDRYIPREKLVLVFLVIVFNCAIHIPQLPILVSIYMLGIWGYRFLCLYRGWELPGKVLRTALAFLGWAICFQTMGLQMSEELSMALLATAISVKLLETATYRHSLVSLIVCYYLLVAKLLADISLWTSIYLLLDVIIITVVMFFLSYRSSAPIKMGKILVPVLKMSLQAAPILILLFLVFPRFSTSMFGLRNKEKATTGMSESLNPGEISQLVYSDEPVFRAKFESGVKLDSSKLYWKAGVLFENQGMSWSPPRFYQRIQTAETLPTNEETKQEILLEPGNGKFLLALSSPLKIESNNYKFNSMYFQSLGSTFRLKKNLNAEIKYTVTSTSSLSVSPLEGPTKKLYLQLPEVDEPEVDNWLKENISSNDSLFEAAQKIFGFFEQGDFYYSLSPQKLEQNTVQEFLFQTKEGFCEHYAAAFAHLMRKAGYPSRVVIGFLGGEYNDNSGYYLVSNKDAHAWTEIWNEQTSSWVLFDPVTVVAPQRLTLTARQFYESMGERLGAGEFANVSSEGFFSGAWAEARLFIDDLNFRWTMMMMNYDQEKQFNFIKNFGFGRHWRKVLFGVSVLLLLLFVLTYFFFVRRTKKDPLVSIMINLNSHVNSKGVYREASETPQAFLRRCRSVWPENGEQFSRIESLYSIYRYGKKLPSAEDLGGLKALVKSLRLTKVNS